MAVSCLRCDGPLERLERAAEIQFWRCTHCQRDYAERAGELTDRWVSPLSIVLYGIIFSHRPQDDASHIARQLLDADHLGEEKLRRIVAEIREELARAKQQVRNILPLAHDDVTEADVREFLARVADELTREIDSGLLAPQAHIAQ